MDSFIHLFKNVFLFVTTCVTIYFFFKNYKKGFIVYLLFLCFSGLLGFSRPIFAEAFILPVLIVLTIHGQTYFTRVNFIWLLLLFICLLNTLIWDNPIDSYDVLFIFGIILFVYSGNIFQEDKFVIKLLSIIWLYVLCRSAFLVFSLGSDILMVADASEGASRLINYSVGDNEFTMDPNYLGFYSGIGAVLSFMYVVFRSRLKQELGYRFLNKSYATMLILVIGLFELFLTLRGLSRGMLLALVVSLAVYIIMQKNMKHFWYMILFLLVSFAILYNTKIYNMYVLRFLSDTNGAGRYDIWELIINHFRSLGIIPVLLGVGLNYPWWKFDSNFASMEVYSTHNSLLTFFMILGLFGIIVLFYSIFKSYYIVYKYPSYINLIKIVLLTFCVIGMVSIEPLHYTWGWIPLVVGCSIKKNNY